VSFGQQKLSQQKQSTDKAVKNGGAALRSGRIPARHGVKAQSQDDFIRGLRQCQI